MCVCVLFKNSKILQLYILFSAISALDQLSGIVCCGYVENIAVFDSRQICCERHENEEYFIPVSMALVRRLLIDAQVSAYFSFYLLFFNVIKFLINTFSIFRSVFFFIIKTYRIFSGNFLADHRYTSKMILSLFVWSNPSQAPHYKRPRNGRNHEEINRSFVITN